MLGQRLGGATTRGSRRGSMAPARRRRRRAGRPGLAPDLRGFRAVARPVVLFTPETHLLDVPPRFRGARRGVAAVGPLPAAGRLHLPLFEESLPVRLRTEKAINVSAWLRLLVQQGLDQEFSDDVAEEPEPVPVETPEPPGPDPAKTRAGSPDGYPVGEWGAVLTRSQRRPAPRQRPVASNPRLS